MTVDRTTSALNDADEVRRELRAALAEAGITLPSLTVDVASCCTIGRRPLIELGRCNLDTARDLAAALRPAGERPRAEE